MLEGSEQGQLAAPAAPPAAVPGGASEVVDDAALNLHVQHTHAWLGRSEAAGWWRTIMEHAQWFRVKYKSARFGSDCETPCWTTFFGGSAEVAPYEPVPVWLQPLVSQV